VDRRGQRQPPPDWGSEAGRPQIDVLPASVVALPRAEVGECPLFDPATGVLYGVDIPRGRLWRWDTGDNRFDYRDFGEPLGSLALVDGGGYLLATRSGVHTLAEWDAQPQLLCPLEPNRPTQCNDGKCDPRGLFVIGTASTDQSCDGALYAVGHDGTVRQLIDGIGMSNGLDWSPDGRWLYYVDSLAGSVTRFAWDADPPRLCDPAVLVSLAPSDGLPDGLTVDAEGCLWIAVWGAGEVRRYDPAGKLKGTVSVPTPNVTSCAFRGESTELFITTAATGVAESDPGYELAGSIFVARTGVSGRPTTRFGVVDGRPSK
jgi:L-arabinonolactonase